MIREGQLRSMAMDNRAVMHRLHMDMEAKQTGPITGKALVLECLIIDQAEQHLQDTLTL